MIPKHAKTASEVATFSSSDVLADEAVKSPSADTFKTRDASSYDAVTEEFERFTDRLTHPLAERMVRLARLAPAQQVLDVGTGTGVVAFQAAQEVGPSGKVLGIDLSDGMLSRAAESAERRNLANCVEFRRMDAEALESEDRSFDRVVSLFALLHFPNPLAALKEMFRVLRPGGRIVVGVGSGAPLFSLTGLNHCLELLPEILLKLQGKRLIAPDMLNQLVGKHFPETHEQEQASLAHHSQNRTQSVPPLFLQAGFKNIRSEWQGHRAEVQAPEEFWDMQRTFSSIARKRLSGASLEKVNLLRNEFLTSCRSVQSRGGKLVYPFAAFFIIAERP